jgi:hypothetical protein
MGMKKCCDNCSGFKCLLTALEDALVAGKGLGEDRTNGAAAQMAPPLAQSSPPGKKSKGGESPREGKGLRNRGR